MAKEKVQRLCKCGCGRPVSGRNKICDSCKRKREEDREKAKLCECGLPLNGKRNLCKICQIENFMDNTICSILRIRNIHREKKMNSKRLNYYMERAGRSTATSIFDNSKGIEYLRLIIYHTSGEGISEELIEHPIGRKMAQILIYKAVNKIMDDEPNTDEYWKENFGIDRFYNLMMKFCFIFKIQKCGKFHTKVNLELKKLQEGQITFDQYNAVLRKYGYEEIDEKYKYLFDIF